MRTENGAKLWLVQGLKYQQDERPIFVTDGIAVVRDLGLMPRDGKHITIRDRGIYEIGHGAFPTEAEAYEYALVMQGKRLAALGNLNAKHIQSWNNLLERSVRDAAMPPGFVTENFGAWEFLCPDCKVQHMNHRFIMRLQLSRVIAGIAYVPGSGWRCPVRNAAVGGVEDSSHMTGLAADIMATTSEERYKIVQACMAGGFTRIGVARYYIHVDTDPGKPPGVMWLY